jgi:hypothetical protein
VKRRPKFIIDRKYNIDGPTRDEVRPAGERLPERSQPRAEAQ